jgi:uncharacterized damage-inducible protein DinB
MKSGVLIARPEVGEYDPYYQQYLDLVPDGIVLDLLEAQLSETLAAVGGLSDEQARFRYASGKWSVKEVLGHLADVERVLSYRAFRISRADRIALAGFEENDYIANANYDERPLESVAAELAQARAASLAFYRSITPEMTILRGMANEAEVTVRALAWITVGHEKHHTGVLRERYLGKV